MVVKTTGGDYLMVWRLGGLPFVGRDEWEIEHRHNTFNRLLQTLRAPDFVNVPFWVHDIRRKRKIRDRSQFRQAFTQETQKSVVTGKGGSVRVDFGGRRIITKKK